MNLDEIQEQGKMFDQLYKTFYEPYFSAAVKCGDVDTAINSLFVGCFVQPEAEQIYQIVHEFYRKKFILTKIAKTN